MFTLCSMPKGDVIISTGSLDFSAGVDSLKTSTVASTNVPNGLTSSQLSWLANATMRDGALSPRDGWQKKGIIPVTAGASVPAFPTPSTQDLTSSDAWDLPDITGAQAVIPTETLYSGNIGDITTITNVGGGAFSATVQIVAISNPTFGTPTVTIQIITWVEGNAIDSGQVILFTLQTIAPPYVYLSNAPLFQGAFLYSPTNATPYIIAVIGGHVFKIDPDFNTAPVDLSIVFDLYFPAPLAAKCFFVQAEYYLVIQAGDYNPTTGNGTLPLFWDGMNLSQSNGLTGVLVYGTPAPQVYSLTQTQPFVLPDDDDTVTVYLSQPYPGFLFDKVDITVSAAATGSNAGKDLGIYEVQQINPDGSIVLYCYSHAAGGPGGGTTIALDDSPLVFTLQVRSPGTQTVTLTPTGTLDNAGSGGGGVPPAGQTFNIYANFSSSYFNYIAGDVIQLFMGTTDYGTFSVVAVFAGGTEYPKTAQIITLRSINPLQVGADLTGKLSYYFCYRPTGTPPGPQLIIPTAGGYLSLNLNTAYFGSVGDIISIPNAGLFLVVQILSGASAIGQTGVLLRAISPINAGHLFLFGFNPYVNYFTLTVVQARTVSGQLINQIPAATCMAYYQGRIWYAQGDTVSGGDIVGSASGTSVNNYIDSVLSVTQNQAAFGGDGFTMPLRAGNITGMAISANIDASLGQGLLMIGTPKAIFALSVPVSEEDWTAATASNPPQIVVVQLNNGWVNDTGIVVVNGDLFFQSLEPGIRSLITAVRYFQQWGNVQLSSNEDRILSQCDKTLLTAISGIYWNNYLLMTTLPKQTPYGIVHSAIIPLDFTPIFTLEDQLPPNWEGDYEGGIEHFQLLEGSFNGLDRAFSIALNPDVEGQIEVWELVSGQLTDNGDNRIQWQATFPAFTWGKEFDLKRLISAELWFDQISGIVDVKVEYFPDSSACPVKWFEFQICSARNSSENAKNPVSYPLTPYAPGYKQMISLPEPPEDTPEGFSRPASQLYQCQPRLTIKGSCRLRGIILHAELLEKKIFRDMVQ